VQLVILFGLILLGRFQEIAQAWWWAVQQTDLLAGLIGVAVGLLLVIAAVAGIAVVAVAER